MSAMTIQELKAVLVRYETNPMKPNSFVPRTVPKVANVKARAISSLHTG